MSKGRVELDYQINLVEGINEVSKGVKQLDQALKELKMPKAMTQDTRKELDDLKQKIEKFRDLSEKPIKTQTDFSKIKKDGDEIVRLYNKIYGKTEKLSKQAPRSIFMDKYGDAIKKVESALKSLDNETKKYNKDLTSQVEKQEKAKKKLDDFTKKYGKGESSEEQKKYLSYQKGSITRKRNSIQRDIETGKISKKEGNAKIAELATREKSLDNGSAAKERQRLEQDYNQITQSLINLKKAQIGASSDTNIVKLFTQIRSEAEKLGISIPKDITFQGLDSFRKIIESFPEEKQREIAEELNKFSINTEKAASGGKALGAQLEQNAEQINNLVSRTKDMNILRSRLEYVFGMTGMLNIFRRAIQSTVNTIKELDSVMTETAVVTDYTVSDMWNKIDEYADVASKLGVSIKGVYEVTTLLYQMGMNTSQAMGAGIEILKMARIAGMDYASATDAMVSALKGFNMEVNEINAQKVNDIYSRIAAISASNVQELSTAMSKTASIAANAGMSVENTTALLAQGIERTRESAETIGTALKTVTARFNEMKKAPSEIEAVDGEVVDANKIETALRTAGIALRDVNGEIRNTDDVLFELSEKWNTLSKNTRAYIATQAAGSRQQSRFIAMISDYQRLSQFQEEAVNSAGASNKQFEKTLDSLETKLQNLRNQVDTFLTQIMDSKLLKFLVDVGKDLAEISNKITNLPGILGSISKVALGMGVFKGGGKLIDLVFGSLAKNNGKLSGLGLQMGKNIFGGIKNTFIKGKNTIQNLLSKAVDYKGVVKNNSLAMNNYATVVGNLNKQLKAGQISEKVYAAQIEQTSAKLGLSAVSAQAYNAVVSEGMGIKGADILLQKEELAQKTLEIIANESLTAEQKKQAIQELINQGIKKEGIVLEKTNLAIKLKSYAALLLGSKATREAAVANLGYASTAQAATQATNLFSKALYKIPFLGWILVAIAAIATLTAIIISSIRTTQESIDNADEAAERASSRIQELSNEIENLTDTFSKIQELSDSFDDLTKGSVEWTAKLIENNQYLEDLIDKYQVLQEYLAYDEQGIAYFKEGYEKALINKLQEEYQFQRRNKISNEYEAARLRYQTGEITYQEYKNAQTSYLSQGVRSGTQDNASIAAANLFSKNFSQEFGRAREDVEDWLKGKAGGGVGTYWNDKLEDIGEELGLWYKKDGKIYNDAEHQTELDYNEDDMAEQIIANKTLAEIQKNTKETANVLRQEDQYTQKLLSGNWKNITYEDFLNKNHQGTTKKEKFKTDYEKDKNKYFGDLLLAAGKQDYKNVYDRLIERGMSPGKARGRISRRGQGVRSVLLNSAKEENEDISSIGDESWRTAKAKPFWKTIPFKNKAYSRELVEDFYGTDAEITKEDYQALVNLEEFNFDPEKTIDKIAEFGEFIGVKSLKGALESYLSKDKEKIQKMFEEKGSEYSEFFGTQITYGIMSWAEKAGGFNSGFAQILKQYTNEAGVKDIQEVFKGLELSEKATVDNILDYIQVQRNLGNETSILTDNFIKLTEGMTLSQEKLQEWYQTINKAARITEGKTGYDTYTKDEIEALVDSTAISSDDVLRVGEDSYKVINKTAEQITHYLGSWDAKISGANKGNENNLKFISMLSDETDTNRNQFIKTGSAEGSDLKFGTQENQDIYQVAKGIHEAGGVGVVTDYEAKTGLGAGQMSMTDAKTAYKRLLFQQQVLANNITDDEEATKLWNKIDAQVNREMVSPEAIQQALNGFISENYYENVADYEAAQNASFLLDAGESGYRSDTSRDKMYNSSSEAMRETAQKATQLVVNERNLNSVVQMVTSTVSKQNPSLAKNSDLMKELAIAISDAQNGFEAIREVINDCEEDLKDFGSIKYYQAIDKIAQAFKNMGITGADSTWVGANLEDIMDFYNGSASAANRLYKSLVKIKLAQMDNTEMASQLQTVINGLTFDTEGIGTFTDTANAMLTALVGETGKNMSDIEEIFKSFGVDLEYIYGADGKITGVKAVNQLRVGANYNKRETQKEKANESKWENSYDWLYNLTQKINEELRIREKLEKRYDRILNNRRMNEKDIIAAREQELQSLMKELDLQTEMYEKRRGELATLLRDNKDLTKYATYDFENNMVQINWDKINKVSDETLGGRIEKFIEKLENAESEFENAFDSIEDIYDTVQDIYNDSRQNYLDFENRVLEAVVNQYQLEIDRLTEIDNSINDSNSKLLDSIQKSIDAQRQARQNAETEENLADKLNQLLYKRQDRTSSLTELKTLEKELEDSRQDYIDTLVDQKISELQEQNDEAAEQRQRQIELMEGQLEQAKDQGLLWDEVNLLLKEGIYGSDGQINQNSKLVQILQQLDKYNGLSEEGKNNWLDELSIQYKQYEEFGKLKGLLSENLNTIGTRLENLGSQLNTLDWTIKETGDKIVQGYRSSNQDDDDGIKNLMPPLEKIAQNIRQNKDANYNGFKRLAEIGQRLKDGQITEEEAKKLVGTIKWTVKRGQNGSEIISAYATGGLADFTGPAWLDGTKSRPELVLNQRDTQNFIQLKDILSSIMSNNIPSITEGARTANSNFEINVNVDKIANDYDVDRLVERVKKDIVEDSSYRNPVVLSLLR